MQADSNWFNVVLMTLKATSCNLQCNSTLGRCKIGKYKFPSHFANISFTYQTFVTNLHLLRVELHSKLQERALTLWKS